MNILRSACWQILAPALVLLLCSFEALANPLDIQLGEAFPQPAYLGLTTTLPITIEPINGANTVSGLSAQIDGGAGQQPVSWNFDLVSHDCPGTITATTAPVRGLEWTGMGSVSGASPIDCSIKLSPRNHFGNPSRVTLRVDCTGCTGDADDRASREVATGLGGDMEVSLAFNEAQETGLIFGTLTYRNVGLGEARNIGISMFGDPALFVNLDEIDNQPGCNDNVVVTADSRAWTAPNKAPGEFVTCRFNTTIPAPGSYELFALVTATTEDGIDDPWTQNNSDQVTMVATELVVDTRFSFLPDADPGDGVCLDSQGNCSLRAAVDETNALPGLQTIVVPYQVAGYFLGGLSDYLLITDPVVLAGVPDPATGALPWITRTDSDNAGLIRIATGASETIETELWNLDLRGNATRQLSVNGGVIRQNGPLLIKNSKISGGWTSGDGGGLYGGRGLRLRDVEIFGNRAGFGGGLFLLGGNDPLRVDVSMIAAAVHDNIADSNGGGLFNLLSNVTVDQGSFYGNEAVRGGGIYFSSDSRALITNTTISDNQAAQQGAGLYQLAGARRTTLDFVTVAYNSAGPGDANVGDGGGIFTQDADVQLINSILAFNTARSSGGPFGTVVAGNCSGVLDSQGYNTIAWIDGDPDCTVFQSQPTDAYNLAPGLAPLTIEDSGIAYHPLTRVNHEIDRAGESCVAFPESYNLRDNANRIRPLDGDADGEARCDRGAYEALPFALSLSTTSTSAAGWRIELDNDLLPCSDEQCNYAAIPPGQFVTLTAVPEPGTAFAGWGGACSGAGTGDCTLDMTQSREVTASFEPDGQTAALTVVIDGEGLVLSQPAGIDCPASCQADFPLATEVNLTPTPLPGHAFSHWTGDCSGSAGCQLGLSQARSVGAVFVELEDGIFSSRFEN